MYKFCTKLAVVKCLILDATYGLGNGGSFILGLLHTLKTMLINKLTALEG